MFASGLGRAVLTRNADDFRELHDADPNHHGIIAFMHPRGTFGRGTTLMSPGRCSNSSNPAGISGSIRQPECMAVRPAV